MSAQTVLDPTNDLVEQAKRVLPGGSFGNMPAEVVLKEGKRRPHLGRGRPRVRRLPAGLGADVRRPRPSRGDGGGAGAGAARHHLLRQQPPRHRARRGDLRCRALRRPGALRLLGHRGRSLRHARGPRLQEARQDPEVRGRLSRHERLRADVAGAQAAGQFSAADARFGGHPEVGGRRDAGRGLQRHRHGGKPDRGAEGRARRRHRRAVPAPDPAQARLPAGAARRDQQARHPADLRRGRDRLPLRLWRGAGILRRHARPLQPGQDRGRRLRARRHRRPRRHHEALRPAGHDRRGFHLPGRHAVGQSGGRGGGPGDAGDPEAARRLRAGVRAPAAS